MSATYTAKKVNKRKYLAANGRVQVTGNKKDERCGCLCYSSITTVLVNLTG